MGEERRGSETRRKGIVLVSIAIQRGRNEREGREEIGLLCIQPTGTCIRPTVVYLLYLHERRDWEGEREGTFFSLKARLYSPRSLPWPFRPILFFLFLFFWELKIVTNPPSNHRKMSFFGRLNKVFLFFLSIDLKMLSLYIFLKLFFRMRRIKFWRPTRGSIWWVGLNDFIHSHHLRHRIDFFILPCAHKRAKLKSPHIITIFLLILKFHLIFTLDFFLSNSQLCFTGLERSELDMESCELQWR